ncbi:CHAT domain-containing protein [Raineya orbicola]|uniref:CHAT domain n=1 Tax=Raineya orbicola TaxID=2016530 RepID=A0A2N3IIP0_9BACT|nr:CHAT domain-containing protein [Raineya orbicola]PKQ70202.1 CHAT domain [Raineya orbicola]
MRFLMIFFLLPCWLFAQQATRENWGSYKNEIETHFEKADYLKAIEPLLKAKQWFETQKLTESLEYAIVLIDLGECYYQTYDLNKSAKFYGDGILALSNNKSAPKNSGTLMELAYITSHLAHVLILKGDFVTAKGYLDGTYQKVSQVRAENLKKNVIIDTLFAVTSLYKTYGDLHFAQNDLAGAEKYYRKALNVASKETRHDLVRTNIYGSIILALADMYDLQGLPEKQIKELESLINYYEINVGEPAKKLKEYILALKKAGEFYAKQVISEKDSISKDNTKEKAANYLHQALTFQKEISEDNAIYADVLLALSRYLLYTEPSRTETAFKLAKSAYSLFYKNYTQPHVKHIESANLAGFIALHLKKYNEAEELFALALKAAPVLNDKYHIYLLHLHFNTGLAMMYQNKNSLAAIEFLSGSWIIEEQIRRNFAHLTEKEKEALYKTFNENILLYAYFVSENYSQIQPLSQLLFNLLLHTKGFLFNQNRVFVKSILQSKNENLKKKFQKWQALKAELAKKQQSTNLSERNYYQSGKSILEQDIEKLEKDIASQNAEFQKKVTDKNKQKRIDWTDVQSKLKEDEALVEIVRTYSFKNGFHQDSAIYLALIIKPNANQVELIKFSDGYEMENGSLNFYRNSIRFRKKDNESYNIYWKPIAEQLKGVKRLYFCPDGIYHQINPRTLFNPATNTYVADELEVRMISRSADLIEIRNRKAQEKKFAVYQMYLFGYLDYSNLPNLKIPNNTPKKSSTGKSFRKQRFFNPETSVILSLPGTKKEVENIASFAQKAGVKTQVFQELQANEENLKKLQNPDILHIATHGFFEEESEEMKNPLLRSGLILAGAELAIKKLIPDTYENGILTAQEVLSLDLETTELVALSACETGLGEIKNGEGVYGLQRAFLQAGTQSLIVSLWKVDDAATQEFMSSFYENWLVKKMPKTEAFTQAQQSLKQKYKEPYYWGAFVIVG